MVLDELRKASKDIEGCWEENKESQNSFKLKDMMKVKYRSTMIELLGYAIHGVDPKTRTYHASDIVSEIQTSESTFSKGIGDPQKFSKKVINSMIKCILEALCQEDNFTDEQRAEVAELIYGLFKIDYVKEIVNDYQNVKFPGNDEEGSLWSASCDRLMRLLWGDYKQEPLSFDDIASIFIIPAEAQEEIYYDMDDDMCIRVWASEEGPDRKAVFLKDSRLEPEYVHKWVRCMQYNKDNLFAVILSDFRGKDDFSKFAEENGNVLLIEYAEVYDSGMNLTGYKWKRGSCLAVRAGCEQVMEEALKKIMNSHK